MYFISNNFNPDLTIHVPYLFTLDGSIRKEVVVEKDENLRRSLEKEVFEDVTTALAEKNKYYPSGTFPLPELWNFIQERNASIAAGVSHILNHLKTNKRTSSKFSN